MDTNSNSESANPQDGGTQQTEQNQQSKEATLMTNFLELGKPNKGEHTLALVYPPGHKRGTVVAKIHISYEGDPKKAVFIAKDLLGNPLYPPNSKLWELKKTIQKDSIPLLKIAQIDRTALALAKPEKGKGEPIIQKEAKAIGKGIASEGMQFAKQTKDIVMGTGRAEEVKAIRRKKLQRSKNVGLER